MTGISRISLLCLLTLMFSPMMLCYCHAGPAHCESDHEAESSACVCVGPCVQVYSSAEPAGVAVEPAVAMSHPRPASQTIADFFHHPSIDHPPRV